MPFWRGWTLLAVPGGLGVAFVCRSLLVIVFELGVDTQASAGNERGGHRPVAGVDASVAARPSAVR